jgi:hypothetical protein
LARGVRTTSSAETQLGAVVVASDDSLGRLAAGGLGRMALGACVLGLVAIILTGLGATGLGGSLGSLFGFGSHKSAATHRAQLTARPTPAAPHHQVTGSGAQRTRAVAPHGRRPARERHRPPAQGRRPSPLPESSPQPAPQPGPAPAPPPPPPSRPAVVKTVENQVEQTGGRVPEPVAPLIPIPQAVQQIDSACALLGGCP